MHLSEEIKRSPQQQKNLIFRPFNFATPPVNKETHARARVFDALSLIYTKGGKRRLRFSSFFFFYGRLAEVYFIGVCFIAWEEGDWRDTCVFNIARFRLPGKQGGDAENCAHRAEEMKPLFLGGIG